MVANIIQIYFFGQPLLICVRVAKTASADADAAREEWSMTALRSLDSYLEGWAVGEHGKPVAETVRTLGNVCKTIASCIRQGQLAGAMGAIVGSSSDGDAQKELDRLANVLVIEALQKAPVAYIASEELVSAVATGNPEAPLIVAVDPLDGSSNIDTNVAIGTIFSIMPKREDARGEANSHFFQPGSRQVAAGYVIYGTHTALVLTLGTGTLVFTLDPSDGQFKLTLENIRVPATTHEFAINASNYRHWEPSVRAYIDDCLQGREGPRGKNFNTRWVGSMVAECHRILMRGGIYLYTGDAREGYAEGRLRLIYEGNPVAFLMQQAGGLASTGRMRILDIMPTDVHQRVPLIFGSANEVELIEGYYGQAEPAVQNSPLFGRRGLFRS
jgi:fructose-1,6-bisphosphatase I